MVYFITGPICSGKPTCLLRIYNSLNCGDGFYNTRRYINNQYIGQDLIHLATGKSIPFSRIRGYTPVDWDETESFYEHSFSKRGLTFAKDIANGILKRHRVAFIDELGPLELKGRGLFICFKKLCKANLDIYTVCRSSCVKPVTVLFKIKEYFIL